MAFRKLSLIIFLPRHDDARAAAAGVLLLPVCLQQSVLFDKQSNNVF